MQRGADGLIADLREALLVHSTELSAVDRSRLCELVQLARTFKDLALPRPLKFVEAVSRQKLSKASSARVRLMTIHGAKGLGFEEVILMGADQLPLQEADRMANFVGYAPNVADGPQVVVPGVNKDIRQRWFPAIHVAAAENRVRDCIDCLSEAYVALTRSVSAIHCVFSTCGNSHPNNKKTLGGLLSRAYDALGDVWSEDDGSSGVVWALGDQGEFTIHTSDAPEDQASTLTSTQVINPSPASHLKPSQACLEHLDGGSQVHRQQASKMNLRIGQRFLNLGRLKFWIVARCSTSGSANWSGVMDLSQLPSSSIRRVERWSGTWVGPSPIQLGQKPTEHSPKRCTWKRFTRSSCRLCTMRPRPILRSEMSSLS